MCNVADISEMSRNGWLYRITTNKELKEGNRGMFYDFTEELRLTTIMEEMEDATVTH